MEHQTSPSDNSHPDYAQLDALRTGEATEQVTRHVHTCRECQNRLLAINHLAAELAQPPAIPVPAAREREILSMIAVQASRVRQKQTPKVTRLPAWLLRVAAALVLVAGAWFVIRHTSPLPVDNPPTSIAADIDGNGRVDIVDAYTLDRMLQRATGRTVDYDVNHDNKVDRQDVRAVASRAVSIKPEDA